MPLFYKPCRDARHRRACLSLYRALVRHGRRVPLPDSPAPTGDTKNPIHAMIRRGFRLNRRDTSPRLVVSALKNGYRFLSLLRTAAESPSGPVYDDVVALVCGYHARFPPGATRTPRPSKKGPPIPPPPENWTPLLTLVKEGDSITPPVYRATNRPRPKEELAGERKVPVLDDTHGFPFLRLGKPQSLRLGHQLSDRISRRREREQLIVRFKDQDVVEAEEEDAWEALLKKQFGVSDRAPGRRAPTYRDSVKTSIAHLATKLNAERLDMVARGQALWEIVEKEKELAEKEKPYWEVRRKELEQQAAKEREPREEKEKKRKLERAAERQRQLRKTAEQRDAVHIVLEDEVDREPAPERSRPVLEPKSVQVETTKKHGELPTTRKTEREPEWEKTQAPRPTKESPAMDEGKKQERLLFEEILNRMRQQTKPDLPKIPKLKRSAATSTGVVTAPVPGPRTRAPALQTLKTPKPSSTATPRPTPAPTRGNRQPQKVRPRKTGPQKAAGTQPRREVSRLEAMLEKTSLSNSPKNKGGPSF